VGPRGAIPASVSQVAEAEPAARAAPAGGRAERLVLLARSPRAPTVVFAVLAALAAILILLAGRGTIFFFDEWNLVLDRRGWSVSTLLDPHEGHLVLVPVLIYKALFGLVGLQPYWPYRVVDLSLHLACAALIYAIVRRRLGGWAAVGVAALVLFLGSAWEVLLWPFQIAYLGALVAGLGAWLVLQEPGRGRDWAGALLLLIALASSGVGVPIALGVLVALLLVEGARRRAWVAVGPLVLYGIWLLADGLQHPASAGGVKLANLPDAPAFMAKMAAAGAGGIAGIGLDWGQVLLALLVVLVVARIARHALTPWLTAALVMALSFWALTALGRAQVGDPQAPRYIYPTAVFLLLALVELPVGAGRARLAWGPAPCVMAVLAVAFAALGNSAALRDGGRTLRDATNAVMPALAAVELGGNTVAPDYRVEPTKAPQITAARYLATVRDLGSPLPTGLIGQLRPPNNAATIDGRILPAERIGLSPRAPTPGATAPAIVLRVNGAAQPDGAGCLRFAPTRVPSALDLRVAPGATLAVTNAGRPPVQLRTRRFGPDFPTDALGEVPAGQSRSIAFPRDKSGAPWIVRVSPAQPVVACLAG
jgi:hypothetical protein